MSGRRRRHQADVRILKAERDAFIRNAVCLIIGGNLIHDGERVELTGPVPVIAARHDDNRPVIALSATGRVAASG